MCRFKKILAILLLLITSFQYILCVGSSLPFANSLLNIIAFQYILCVGSSQTLPLYPKISSCFNTSYVSVQVH